MVLHKQTDGCTVRCWRRNLIISIGKIVGNMFWMMTNRPRDRSCFVKKCHFHHPFLSPFKGHVSSAASGGGGNASSSRANQSKTRKRRHATAISSTCSSTRTCWPRSCCYLAFGARCGPLLSALRGVLLPLQHRKRPAP